MVTNISYNVMIDRLRAFADGHYLIKKFSHGQIDLRYLEQDADYYPWMHVIPGTITPREGLREYSFDITFSDLTRDKEHEAEYIREAISDCTRLAEDLLAEIKNGNTLFDPLVQSVDGSTITPFIHEDTHTLTGVTLSLSIRVPWNWSACDIPADYALGGSGSGGGAEGGCCVTLQVGGVDNIDQTLLNLIAGTNMTITDNGDGSVTFDSTGGGGGSVSWGSILGTLSNQTDLQNALNLKADISLLATVATSGDYNDLTNLPTIPAAQVNSDWNAVSGVAEILNKPTIPTSLPPSGNAGGDLTNSYPNPTVHRIHGVDMQSGTPSTDEVWVYGGSPAKWQHQHLGADQVTNTSGVTGTSVKDALDHLDSTKQATLVSGTNIKTIEGQSLVGSGNIDLTKTDVGLSNVDNTSDLSKPISTATQTALNAKEPTITAGTTSQYYRGDKTFQTHNIASVSDSTTVGQNLVKLANPSAIRYIRINSDNTASTIDAATLRSELGIPSGTQFRLVKTSDQSITASNTTPADITDLTFTITSGKKYKFRATIIHSTTALASIRLGINASVSVNSVYQQAFLSLAPPGSNVIVTYTWNTLGVITNSQAGSNNLLMSVVDGILDAGTTGTAAMQFSKIQAVGGTLLIKAGSILEYSEY